MFAIHAHVFQIDPKTKKKWIPSSSSAVRVAFYHDPSRGTYRIIAIETNKVSRKELAECCYSRAWLLCLVGDLVTR